MFLRSLILISISLLLSACASSTFTPAPVGLPTNVVNMLHAANIPTDAMGAIVIRMPNGATVLSHRADVSMQPASTLKLLTSIVGLEKLGPTYRGRTELRTRGELVAGGRSGELTLRGDLVLRGVGNADLNWEAFQAMLQTLRHKGISDISGDMILDRQWFQPPRPDAGVPPFDETPEFRYNVIPDALLLNTNLVQLELASGAQTPAVRVGMTPSLDRVTVTSNLTLVDRVCDKWEEGWTLPTVSRSSDGAIQIELHGEFPKNCSAMTQINIIDRVDFADRLFRALWRNLGGTFSGQTRESIASDAPTAGMRLLAQHQSRTLAEVTRDINKRSDNPITRQVYLSLGALLAESSGMDGDTSRRAEAQVRAWLKQRGIDDTGLTLENGSGLSRTERIRPAQLAAVLQAAHRSDWAPEFLASLPIAAVDGGMRNRLRNSPAAGRARLKTGSLRDVAALAGFVPCAGNEICIVVVMINHPLAAGTTARPILDALIDWVARNPG